MKLLRLAAFLVTLFLGYAVGCAAAFVIAHAIPTQSDLPYDLGALLGTVGAGGLFFRLERR